MVHCFESWKLQPASIKGLIAGIQFHLRCADSSIMSLLGNPSINLLLQGFRRVKPQVKHIRLPFTFPLLHKLITHLRKWFFGHYTDLLIETVFLTAFFVFLRVREFTTQTKATDPSRDLTITDITMSDHFFCVFFKHSKTDRNKKGTNIVIAKTNSAFCPFFSMSHYLGSRTHANPMEPQFPKEDGKPLTKAWFTSPSPPLSILWSPPRNVTQLIPSG